MTVTRTRTRTRTHLALLIIAVSGLGLGIAACGGDAAPAPKSPDTKPGMMSPKSDKDEEVGEPQTVEEAQKQIANLRASIDSRKSALDLESGKKTSEKPPESSATTPPANTRRPPATDPAKPTTPGGGGTAPRDDSKATSSGSEDLCVSPCRALASMKRAVDALCRMTGDADTRCVDAKKTLTDSTTRVATCKCESR
jgi:hypothetical protein